MAPPKTVILSTFFDQLLAFIKELSAMYPEDADFPMALTTIRLLKSTTPAFVIKHFYDSSKSYEDQITTKNEGFFLDHSFSEFSEDVTFDFNLLAKLKEYVQSMPPDSKEAVWVYIQNLYKLAKVYNANTTFRVEE